MSNQEAIEKLEIFKKLLSDYFDGNYDNESELKSEINYLLPIVQSLVIQADCLKTMTVAPPPAVGGMVIQNFNPFDMIFHNFWGISIIPDIINMIEQSIGKYKNNLVIASNKNKQNKEYQGAYPEKITISWLIKHVPIKIWFSGIGLIIAAFSAGLASAPILDKIMKLLEK